MLSASIKTKFACIWFLGDGNAILENDKLFYFHRASVTACSWLLSLCGRYSYMIDNIVLLITGTLHQRAISELIPKCHPLGSFEQMEAIHIAGTPAELYNAVLVDTPLGEWQPTGHIDTPPMSDRSDRQ